MIAGGSGFLGTNLATHLSARGFEVVALTRRLSQHHATWRTVRWDGRTIDRWAEEIDGAAAVVNLCGRTVDCIKTPDHCDEILRSRVESTRILADAINAARTRPPVWVQMSTAHIYGDPPAVVCDESSPFGYGLAPFVGAAWEQAMQERAPSDIRKVVLRTSFVLGRRGGALRRLASLARWGLGGRIGHGRQGMSWIHEHDLNRIFERAITDPNMSGPYIASAPAPVSNAEFMKTLRRTLRRPFGAPAPAMLVRIGAHYILRTDPDLALYGRYVTPKRLINEGFTFEFPTLEPALLDLLSDPYKPLQTPEFNT